MTEPGSHAPSARALVVTLLTVALAGCTGSGSGTGTAPDGAASSTPTATPTAFDPPEGTVSDVLVALGDDVLLSARTDVAPSRAPGGSATTPTTVETCAAAYGAAGEVDVLAAPGVRAVALSDNAWSGAIRDCLLAVPGVDEVGGAPYDRPLTGERECAQQEDLRSGRLAEQLSGLSYRAAAEKARSLQLTVRTVAVDDLGLVGTADFREDRVNVVLHGGRVACVSIG